MFRDFCFATIDSLTVEFIAHQVVIGYGVMANDLR